MGLALAAVAQSFDPATHPPSASSLIPKPRLEILLYSRIQYSLYFVSVGWNILGLCLAVKLGLCRAVLDKVDQFWRITSDDSDRTIGFARSLGRVAILYAVLSLWLVVWRMPVTFSWYLIEKRYGFATQSLGLWLSDRAASYLFGLVSIPVIWFGYWLLKRSPARWWLWLWAGSIPWLITTVAIVPIVVDPVYNHFTPLPDSPLRRDILALANKAGIGVVQVFRVDSSRRSTKVNAYVTGVGPSRRIVIWDTTLKKLPEDQILAVLGHEMGHYVLRHIWRSIVIGIFGAFCFLFLLSRALPWAIQRVGSRSGIRATSDPAGLALAMLILYIMLFLQTPIDNAILRYNEHEADRYGLELTRLNEATARAYAGFVEQNYSDPDPPRFIVFWLSSHPTIRERVEFALSFHP